MVRRSEGKRRIQTVAMRAKGVGLIVVPRDGVLEVTQKNGRIPFESPVSQCETKFHIDFPTVLSTMHRAPSEFSPV